MRSRMLAGGQMLNEYLCLLSDRARHRSRWQGTRHLRRLKLGAFADLPWIDHKDKGESRGAIWCSTSTATSDLQRSSNVRTQCYLIPAIAKQPFHTHIGPMTRQPRTSISTRVQCYIWSWRFVVGDDRWDTTVEVEFRGVRYSELCVLLSFSPTNYNFIPNQIHLFVKSVLFTII